MTAAIPFPGRSESGGDRPFGHHCADAIVGLLRGHTPVMPSGLSLPEGFAPANDPDVAGSWGYLALRWWSIVTLSSSQRAMLMRQCYDLDGLGNEFLAFLLSDRGVSGRPICPPRDFILKAEQPGAQLKEWFGRFLSRPRHSPFAKSVWWKLLERYRDVLSKSDGFTLRNESWQLVGSEPRGRGVDEEQLVAAMLRRIGSVRLLCYADSRGDAADSAPSRSDPLLRSAEAERIARTAIEMAGPLSSAQLATVTLRLCPMSPWAQVFHGWDVDRRGDSDGEDDRSVDESVVSGGVTAPSRYTPAVSEDVDTELHGLGIPDEPPNLTRIDDESIAPSQLASHMGAEDCAEGETLGAVGAARGAWAGMSPIFRVLSALWLFREPPGLLRQIEAWSKNHPGPWGRIPVSKASYYTANSDGRPSRLEMEWRRVTPDFVAESDTLRRAYLNELRSLARKLTGEAAS